MHSGLSLIHIVKHFPSQACPTIKGDCLQNLWPSHFFWNVFGFNKHAYFVAEEL